MRRALSIAIIYLIICLANSSISFSGQTSDAVNAPVWHINDEWTFTGPNMTMKMVVTQTKMIVVSGVNYDTYEVSMSMSGTTTSTGTAYFQRSTLAVVKMIATYQGDTSTIVYSPPLDSFGFPLYAGKTWSVTTTMTYQSSAYSGSNAVSYNFTCLSKETVTVSAGTFEAYKIKQQDSFSSDSYSVNYYSPEAGTFVKGEQISYYDGAWHNETVSILTSYIHSEEVIDTNEGTTDTAKETQDKGASKLQPFLVIVILIIVTVPIITTIAVVFRYRRYPAYPPQYYPRMPTTQYPTPTLRIVYCPTCNSAGGISPTYMGKVRCPNCGTVFEI